MTQQEALTKIKELENYISGSNTVPTIEMIKVENLSTKPFAIGKYPVTQKQWIQVMGTNPSYFEGYDLPVENVSWNDCQNFIKVLNAITGRSFRLPTEYEWLICATIDGTLYSGSNNVDEVAWYTSNSGEKTRPVGQKKPNSLNIYDMSGNVWEWCWDWYDGNYYKDGQQNPHGPDVGRDRVLRGGSWDNPDFFVGAGDCRTADRRRLNPDYRNNYTGYRLGETI